MNTCLKTIGCVFLFIFSFICLMQIDAHAKPSDPGSTTTCTDYGARGICPKIGSFKCTNGDCEIWPAQAVPCECTVSQGWTNCEYPSADFWDYKGSCANDNLYSRKCSFTAQSIPCNSSSVSVKYTCGSWTKETCVCYPGTVQYAPCNTCGTKSRTCSSGGRAWGEWGTCSA